MFKLLHVTASIGRWSKDDEHTPGRRYYEVRVRVLLFGRQLEFAITL